MSDGFKEIVSTVSPHTRDLAVEARKLIYQVYPSAVEVPWPRQNVIGYGVGPKKMSEHFVYLAVSKNHINIGFYYGAELSDPDNLLKGEGKLLKHVRVESKKDLENPSLKKLMEEASRYLPKLDPNDPRLKRKDEV